jgi:hypothetical protein
MIKERSLIHEFDPCKQRSNVCFFWPYLSDLVNILLNRGVPPSVVTLYIYIEIHRNIHIYIHIATAKAVLEK